MASTPDPGYSLGGKVDPLGNEHYSFAEAAARANAESHLRADDSAHIAERDAANSVRHRPAHEPETAPE